jgi:S-adenosylmethionine hydrolase
VSVGTPIPLITLTTDFGQADGTVGAMIGAIKSICAEAEVVNVASDVPAQDIRRGAWALLQAAPFYPADTIHVAVVDPGVGSTRRAILATTERGNFIGPDNGVLSWAWRRAGERRVYVLENQAYRIAPAGVTFDGRDLFAPAAAHLAAGADPAAFGPMIDDPVELPWPEPQKHRERLEGEILIEDHFGNLITNIPISLVMETFADQTPVAVLRGGWRAELSRSYAGITGSVGAVVNGTGLIEIAGNASSAMSITGCKRGDRIVMVPQGVRT